ncbi:TolC family protein [Roseiarcaceae bacterium H3SJ34-1]|uniref:TolC family protein n=1 Tax=Terripilifer ovatus TaxID=3032367 RepID=UPI003AB94067|nr:TolC family protein [Roseiarcaceae bacterium H3SJ34-1]
MNRRIARSAPFLTPFAVAFSLAGCASFSPDGGMSPVQTSVRLDLNANAEKIVTDAQMMNAETRYRNLLKKGLTADRAVQIALLNNKGLQAAYNELGISEAQYIQASLPPNPGISIFRSSGSGELDIERQIAANLLSLLTLPARRDIAETQFKAAQFKAIGATLRLAADARRQFWRAVAASEQAGYLVQARATAQTASELAKRLGETGGLNKLDQSREHAFYAELAAQTGKARVQQTLERERLTRIMGLWGGDIAYALPSRLPALPSKLKPSVRIEMEALERRVDLKLARGELDLVAKQLGLTQATRYINALDLNASSSYSRKVTVDTASGTATIEKTRMRGAGLALEIPIFDLGEARTREAEETYMHAANRLAEKAVNVRSEAREAYLAYKGAWDVARVYQGQVLPLRKAIQDEVLLHYNGMLADLFQIIQDARLRVISNMAAIDARRDFWIASTDLQAAIIGGGMAGGESKPVSAAAGGE